MKEIIKVVLRPFYSVLKKIIFYIYIRVHGSKINEAIKSDRKKVFYLGVTEHSNLGDLAQHYCIKKWIDKNLRGYEKYEFEATTIVDEKYDFIAKLKNAYNDGDIIVFQSGYTTQDLGGVHELMHRLVTDNMSHARILMMPQTIYFKHEKNKERTAKSYNQATNMLFLARDMVSYNMALEMFPNIKVAAFPDIVTSLIGDFWCDSERAGVLICRRNDGEKLYSEEQLLALKTKIEDFEQVVISDTTIKVGYRKIKRDLKKYIEGIIADYSKYKLIITDRYHGTIFSLAANTPVIVIKTTDHKVATGVDWFKGVYDETVVLADSMEDAFIKAKNTLSNYKYDRLIPYFDKKYYQDGIKKLLEELWGDFEHNID